LKKSFFRNTYYLKDSIDMNSSTMKMLSIALFLLGIVSTNAVFVPWANDGGISIQNALNNVGAAGGGVVELDAGTWVIDNQLVIPASNIKVKGSGMDVTILKLRDNAPVWVVSGFVRARLVDNIKISDLTLDGNKEKQSPNETMAYGRYGLFTEGCKAVTFDSVKITRFQHYGFDPHGWKDGGVWGENLVITNCVSSFNGWDGFTLDQTHGVTVRNCTSIRNGRHGFNIVTGSTDVLIEDNKSYDDGYDFPTGSGCGVMMQNNQFFGTKRIVIRNNMVFTPKKAAVCTDDVTDVNVYNNHLESYTCMDIVQTSASTIYDNKCINSSPSRRILVDTLSSVTVTNNQFITAVSERPPLVAVDTFTVTVGFTPDSTYMVTGDAHDVIQSALDAVASNGGGTVIVKPGTYIVSTNIQIGSNTKFIGSGMDKTIIKLMDFAAPWWVGGDKLSGFVRSMLTKDIVVADMTLDGNKAKQYTDEFHSYGRYGLYTETCTNVAFLRVKIMNFQGYGFDPHGDKVNWANNLLIQDCVSVNNGWDGFTLDQTFNIVTKNNTALNNGRHGFNIVTGSRNVLIENNFANGNGFLYHEGNISGCGIAIQNNMDFGTGNVTIRNNYFLNSKKAGVCTQDVYNITVKGNTVENSKSCMMISNTTNIWIEGNTCKNITSTMNVVVYDMLSTVVILNNKNIASDGGYAPPIIDVQQQLPPTNNFDDPVNVSSPSPRPVPVSPSPRPVSSGATKIVLNGLAVLGISLAVAIM
jgi:parallel beta-helix repeat protein